MADTKIMTEPVQKWGKFFYCPFMHQKVILKMCCHRFAIVQRGSMVTKDGQIHPEFVAQFQSCENCYVRKESCAQFRKPNMPQREPRLDHEGKKLLKKLLRKRLLEFGEI